MMTSATEGSDPLGAHNGRGENGRGEIGDVREASRQARAAVREEVQKLIADVESLIRRIGDAADPEVRRMRLEVQNAIASTRQALSDRAEQLQQRAEEMLDASDSYVRAQPWQTIGAVAVAGLVVGLLIGRR